MKELIGVPYERDGKDCRWACVEALRLLGKDDEADSLASMEAIADSLEEWERCRDESPEIGDIVVSIQSDSGLHISVVVAHGRVLTSAEGIGVYTIPVDRVCGTVARYRYTR